MVGDSAASPKPSTGIEAPPFGFAGGSLRNLQLIELGILARFVRLCEQHALTYYLDTPGL